MGVVTVLRWSRPPPPWEISSKSQFTCLFVAQSVFAWSALCCTICWAKASWRTSHPHTQSILNEKTDHNFRLNNFSLSPKENKKYKVDKLLELNYNLHATLMPCLVRHRWWWWPSNMSLLVVHVKSAIVLEWKIHSNLSFWFELGR